MHFIDLCQVDALLPPPPLPFLFLFVVECFSQSSACLFSMTDKNNVHVDRSFSFMQQGSKQSLDETDEDVRREKEKVSNIVSIEESTFSAIVKVRKRKFSKGTLCTLYCDLFKKFILFYLTVIANQPVRVILLTVKLHF